VLPDLDVIIHQMGVAHESVWNHRGFTHSLLFAFLLALAAKAFFFKEHPWKSKAAWTWVCLFFVAAASHGVLDALTDGGSGVAFFAPFDNTRYFLPWQPLRVAPLSVKKFIEGRAIPVLVSEFKWVWLPLLGLWVLKRFFLGGKPTRGLD
jgi:inner membrane protein